YNRPGSCSRSARRVTLGHPLVKDPRRPRSPIRHERGGTMRQGAAANAAPPVEQAGITRRCARMATPSADFAGVLARLARSTVIEDGNLADVLRLIVEAAAATLDVERVNVWTLDRERTRLHCIESYERAPNRHSAGDVI